MGLIETAIRTVKAKEEAKVQLKKNKFRDLFRRVLSINLPDDEIKLDAQEYFTYDGITFGVHHNTPNVYYLKVVKVGAKYPQNARNIVTSLEALGQLLIELGFEEKSLPKNFKCGFLKAWVGICSKESDELYCEEHRKIKCQTCGQQAVRTCDATMGLVCGTPLCSYHECTHKTY